ncbi:MAG: HAMP domain-containing sensor histidine kinase, partial [Ignavibacteria bacterium]|nr:HAMP domain-containing sensor histidine kinase [Ignavibacteria bacterium]
LKKEFSQKLDCARPIEDLSLIIEEASRCKNIVANLLNFARQGKLNLEQINLKELIAEQLKQIKMVPSAGDVELILESSNGFVIEGDRDQLKQVFLNILNNACESMEDIPNKKVIISLESDGENIITKIKDSGCGIPKENIGKIFTPFFTTKKIGKGTGLGLAISYGIIKMHSGNITFESSPGVGTTFKIKLPNHLTPHGQYLN